MADIVPLERIASKIYLIRGIKVMLDRDLAELYEIENRILKQAVRRNIHRFPPDFMFELTKDVNIQNTYPLFLQNKVLPCYHRFSIVIAPL